jgi:hypothetical protein
MGHTEEKHAKELHRRLLDRFADAPTQTEVPVPDGGGWKCFAKNGQRSCSALCFEHRGPVYLIKFQQEEETIAAGRTSSLDEAVEAIWHWLDGNSLLALYDRYGFVERMKRTLIRIRDSVVQSFPDLEVTARSELEHHTSDVYTLWFRGETRSNHIYFKRNRDSQPTATFRWDQRNLFSFIVDDYSKLGAVLKRWLCDGAMPSVLRKEFAWLKIGELADYYEKGNPEEGEFMESWEWIERTTLFPLNENDHVLQFIAQLRRARFDQKLRAIPVDWALIVSRSRHHYVREDQPCIWFQFHDGVMDVSPRNILDEADIPGLEISLSAPVEKVLKRLLEYPIN